MRRDNASEEDWDQEQDQQSSFLGQLNKRLIIGVGVVVLAVAYLIFIGLQEKTALYLSVDELRASGTYTEDRRLRVGGTVVPGSIERRGEGLDVQFLIAEKGAEVAVRYQGAVPDIFEGGLVVFVEGTYTEEALFQADSLLVRHPDTMEPLQDMKAPSVIQETL